MPPSGGALICSYYTNLLHMENLSKDRINQATELYGQPIVAAVLAAIAVAGPEGAHAAYIDLDMPQHADCVQFLHPDESESEQFITFG